MELLPCIQSTSSYHSKDSQRRATKAINNKSISPFLESLLSVSHRSDSNDRPHNHYIVPSFTAPGSRKGKEVEVVPIIEELSWTKSRVIWAKGGSIYRTFTFKEHGQDVVQALFAWFEVSVPTESTSSSSTTTFDDTTSTFGPFQRPPPPVWTDDALALPVDPTASQPPPVIRLERSLVIFLADIAFVYPPSGGTFPFQLPFHLRRAWAMDKGILLEREREGKEVFGAPGGEHIAELATLYSLLNPADEIKVVSSTPSLSNLFSTSTSEYAMAAHPTTPVQDLSDRIIFASDRRDGSEPILVSVNRRSMSVSVWSYGRVDTELSGTFNLNDEAGTEEMSKGTSRDKDHMDDIPPSSRPGGSYKRKRSSVGNVSTLPSNSNDRERLQRRPSTVNGIATGAGAEEADLLEALGESIGAIAMKRTASALSSMSAPDRRGSVTRNELSITMDRMALGVGSSNGIAVNLALSGDMDREATLFVDEGEQTRMISDVMVEKGWEVDLSQGG
jgi:anaphase-promoting complex subunit 1